MSAASVERARRDEGIDSSASPDEVLSFGPFRLHVKRRLLERAGVPLRLGARALDILTVLVDRAGKVVGKNELTAKVWRGVMVDEACLRVQIGALRTALGDGKAGARYVTTLTGQGYCFVAPVLRSSESGPPAPVGLAAYSAHKIPPRLLRMVGRDEAIRDISEQLATHRFVTVTGPGGIGKTTVAISVGHQLLAQLGGAVYFVDLGPFNDPHLVQAVVASALGLSVQSSDTGPGLVGFLRQKRLLLILDSCEHVIEGASALAERIFEEAPEVHILATSRESLRVEGEHVHRLSPLGIPPEEVALTAAQALHFPAIQLFVERAAACGRSFEINDANASVVGELCRRLDGIALAIELAAGRADSRCVRETLTLLNGGFNFPWEGRRTAIPRHQTLNAMLDWSYDFLSETERLVLRRLAVFDGSFTLEAARPVAAGGNLDGAQVSTVLASLIAKSLLAVSVSDQTMLYRLLDVTRAYVAEKLDAS
jgi:predicted ATPase/DNA-binding winged helix-turn-helix (wHTH) protein